MGLLRFLQQHSKEHLRNHRNRLLSQRSLQSGEPARSKPQISPAKKALIAKGILVVALFEYGATLIQQVGQVHFRFRSSFQQIHKLCPNSYLATRFPQRVQVRRDLQFRLPLIKHASLFCRLVSSPSSFELWFSAGNIQDKRQG